MKRIVKQAVNGILGSLGYRVVRDFGQHHTYRLISPILHTLSSVIARPLRIVQVGANDGQGADPLASFIATHDDIEALLIEPHPYPYSLLQEHYADDVRIRLANVAIGDPADQLKLYALGPEWCAEYERLVGRRPDEIASSNRSHVVTRVAERLRVAIDEAREMVRPIDVRFIRLATALEEAEFPNRFDVLQVDAEGFDHEIIMGTDLLFHDVRIVHYERHVLPEHAYASLAAHLDRLGFMRFPDAGDELAVRAIAGDL